MDEKIGEIIGRHLSGTATAQEDAWLGQWRKSPSNEALFQEYAQLWKLAAGHSEVPDVDPATAWARFESTHLKKTTLRTWSGVLVRAAAVILLGLLTIGLYNQIGKPSQLLVESERTVTEIILPDSSHVLLAANSSLSYPEIFSTSRTVTLRGKAFFDVSRNEEVPFIIESGSEQVKVLGTSFTVDTNEGGTEVIVATGRVQLSTQNNSKLLTLSPGEVGSWNKGAGLFSHTNNSDKNFMSWATGQFDFESTSLSDVFEKLNEFYPDSIETELNVDACSLTATFNKQPLFEVMEELSIALGLKYEKTNSGYQITEAACTTE
ncbi:MAG: FecR family protein [Cyclobacteriaceae bacterium]